MAYADIPPIFRGGADLKIIFPEGFDERAASEMPDKGWLAAQMETKNGNRFRIYFSDPVRLQQNLEEEAKLGRPYFAAPGLVILPEVTVAAVQHAVQARWEQGFFAHLAADPSNGGREISDRSA